MRSQHYDSIVVFLLLVLFPFPVFGQDLIVDQDMTIPSGQTYNSITVIDGIPDPPFYEPPTILDFYGEAKQLYTYDTSITNIDNGGQIRNNSTDTALAMYDNSILNIYNGSIGENYEHAYYILNNSSKVNIYEGGSFLGGSGGELQLHGNSKCNIQGGAISCFLNVDNSSVINLYNGDVHYGFYLSDSSTMNIYSGYVGCFIENNYMGPNATLNIYGSGFIYNPEGEWSELAGWVSHLTGYDLDGNPVTYVGIPDPATHNINFIPEPVTSLLLLLGSTGLLKCKSRNKPQ